MRQSCKRELAALMRGQLNEKQVASFDPIVATVNSHVRDPQLQGLQSAFILHGPAGSGKTFLYNCLCSHLQVQGKIVLCVASSGIAALLLPGGRTAHSRFKIPLSNILNAVCNITSNYHLGQFVQKASLIIWDEVLMHYKTCFAEVTQTLNDVYNSGEHPVFGRIPIVLSSDCAQLLPVIRRASWHATMLASIRYFSIWANLQVLKLSTSMRGLLLTMPIWSFSQSSKTWLQTSNYMVILNYLLIFVVIPMLINCVITYILIHY